MPRYFLKIRISVELLSSPTLAAISSKVSSVFTSLSQMCATRIRASASPMEYPVRRLNCAER